MQSKQRKKTLRPLAADDYVPLQMDVIKLQNLLLLRVRATEIHMHTLPLHFIAAFIKTQMHVVCFQKETQSSSELEEESGKINCISEAWRNMHLNSIH